MEKITSKSNEKIKFAVSLRDNASQRKKSGMFFVEGARLCEDAALSEVNILQLFFTEKSENKFHSYLNNILPAAAEAYMISEDVSAKLSDTRSPQGVFCVCEIPKTISQVSKINRGQKYILLENVQDPSNCGAVSRSAEALGIDGMIVCGGCDIYNPKAMRASMGALFRLNVIEAALEDVAAAAKAAGLPLAASTPDSAAVKVTDADFSDGVICIIGNEGNGVSDEAISLCDYQITIPMNGRAESLNASTASAILIWEMVRNGA